MADKPGALGDERPSRSRITRRCSPGFRSLNARLEPEVASTLQLPKDLALRQR
jgi:hypothetical protein